MDSSLERFEPAWWLRGPHGQTAWGAYARRSPSLPYRRERLDCPDGDEVFLDHLDGPPGSPIVVLLHGLEGSSRSVHLQSMARALARKGWRAAALNFRGCAFDLESSERAIPNRLPRVYHSGHTEDLDLVVRTLRAREPGTPIFAAGISLGANVLLKWLGERPDDNRVDGAAAISAPLDLEAGARYLENWTGRIYAEMYLRTLRAKIAELVRRFPVARAVVDLDRVRRARSFWEYDDAATAPLAGFRDAHDYYSRSSSLQFLPSIRPPTLVINAEDDPFLPRQVLEVARKIASSAVKLLQPERGGHVGFVAGPSPCRASYWAERLAVRWLVEQAAVRLPSGQD